MVVEAKKLEDAEWIAKLERFNVLLAQGSNGADQAEREQLDNELTAAMKYVIELGDA